MPSPRRRFSVRWEDSPWRNGEPVQLTEAGGWKHNYFKVEQYMTTYIFSVREDESVDLVANLMEWKRSAMSRWRTQIRSWSG